MSGSPDRTLWQKEHQAGLPKRYKAVMKQVVGAPFTGLLPQEEELDIVRDILAASKRPFDDPGLPATDQRVLLDSLLDLVLQKLKNLIGTRVATYLESITARLLDCKTKLTWSVTKNNCQSFCNALIDPALFEPLVSNRSDPLYLMSFVCPDEGYLQRGVRTKFDVPSGLTEEYLLRFHFGRHDEADVIDTLHEYWYDWGAFGGPLYHYQDIFPWDCTEAYGRYPTRCGECNLAKHVWAFPFDSWSMIAHHLARDRHAYAPGPSQVPSANATSSPALEFHRTRLVLLRASYVLARAAVAMSKTKRFRSSTTWLHSNSPPSATGSARSLRSLFPALARVKLGGIHRAQPFSHYFDAGTYKHYFLAEWALRPRSEQVHAYEELRDGRVRMPDVPRRGPGGPFYSAHRRAGGWPGPSALKYSPFVGFGGDMDVAEAGEAADDWGSYLAQGEDFADCVLTAGDTVGDSTGGGGAGDGSQGGPSCAVSCGSNCGSCSGSATACSGGGGGCSGGGSACAGGYGGSSF